MERFLHLHGLSVGYPTRKVLENIELEIEKGEILTLIGPNGAGKSTLLKSISGQLPLLAGSVMMQGQDLAKCDAKERARRIAVVLTEAVRPEYMTCREVCAAGRYPYTGRMGILRKEDEEAVDRAMARMKVEDLAERDFGAISDGQKQRVLVARALAQETPVLLMDEPTSYLDIRYRTELMETLRGLAAEGKTILMSLHEIDLALEVSDRLLCVKEGGEVFCGTPQEVLAGERIRELFDMPGEMYGKLFGHKGAKSASSQQDHTFFTNRSCKYFPCHKTEDTDNFNCLFCYCPLYAMGPDCGGHFRFTEKGVKDCTGCLVPHKRENYPVIMDKLRAWNRRREPDIEPDTAVCQKTDIAVCQKTETAVSRKPDTAPDVSEILAAINSAESLADCIHAITPPDSDMARLVRSDLDSLAMPPGSLGKIETTAVRMASITGRRKPRAERRRIIVLCADNGLVEEGIGSAPQEVTAAQAVNMTLGLTGMSSIAGYRGDQVQVADIGIATDYHCDKVLPLNVRKGTANIVRGPAMTRDEAERAIRIGIGLAEQASRDNVDIVGVGEMGIGNTTTSAAVISVLTKRTAEDVTGLGGGITEDAFRHKVECVRNAVTVNRPDPEDPVDVLAKVGGLDLAAMCGVFLGCARYRIPVVIDGLISAAAALCAVRLCPDCRLYMFPSHESAEKGYRIAMEAVGIEPWFKLDMRLGEGSGCTMAFGVIEAACAVLDRMATFEKAGIDDSYLDKLRQDVTARGEIQTGSLHDRQ